MTTLSDFFPPSFDFLPLFDSVLFHTPYTTLTYNIEARIYEYQVEDNITYLCNCS